MWRFVLTAALSVAAGSAFSQEAAWSNEKAGAHLEAMETVTDVLCPSDDTFKRTKCLDGLPNYSFAFAACFTAFKDVSEQYGCLVIANDVWRQDAMQIARPDLLPAD